MCGLLALLDLARSGALAENRIVFAPPLLERYQRFFAAARTPSDHPNPYFTFFHLAGKLRGGAAGFWQPRPGPAAVSAAVSAARGALHSQARVAGMAADPIAPAPRLNHRDKNAASVSF